MSTPSDGLVNQALIDLSSGRDRAVAVGRLHGYVMVRLVRLANRLLGRFPRRAADEEDIALDSFQSFCAYASAGRFGRLEDVNDLWRFLYTITRHQASRLRVHEQAQMRDFRRLIELDLDALPDRKPTGEQVTDLVDERETLVSGLRDVGLRQVADLIYEGWSNNEIAEQLHRSLESVWRKRKQIRVAWQRNLRRSGSSGLGGPNRRKMVPLVRR
jgi:DNA-directed RNA polymerase specialized sigma24 family protein